MGSSLDTCSNEHIIPYGHYYILVAIKLSFYMVISTYLQLSKYFSQGHHYILVAIATYFPCGRHYILVAIRISVYKVISTYLQLSTYFLQGHHYILVANQICSMCSPLHTCSYQNMFSWGHYYILVAIKISFHRLTTTYLQQSKYLSIGSSVHTCS